MFNTRYFPKYSKDTDRSFLLQIFMARYRVSKSKVGECPSKYCMCRNYRKVQYHELFQYKQSRYLNFANFWAFARYFALFLDSAQSESAESKLSAVRDSAESSWNEFENLKFCANPIFSRLHFVFWPWKTRVSKFRFKKNFALKRVSLRFPSVLQNHIKSFASFRFISLHFASFRFVSLCKFRFVSLKKHFASKKVSL